MEPALATVAMAVLLGGLWAAATRRHRRRREVRDAEWGPTAVRPDVWTSEARCPHCSASGGIVSEEGEQLWFTCLSCGRRHRRRERG